MFRSSQWGFIRDLHSQCRGDPWSMFPGSWQDLFAAAVHRQEASARGQRPCENGLRSRATARLHPFEESSQCASLFMINHDQSSFLWFSHQFEFRQSLVLNFCWRWVVKSPITAGIERPTRLGITVDSWANGHMFHENLVKPAVKLHPLWLIVVDACNGTLNDLVRSQETYGNLRYGRMASVDHFSWRLLCCLTMSAAFK